MEKELNARNECYYCIHKRSVDGDAHIRCAKPDGQIKGHEHGIRKGWFIYPYLFDPVWKTNMCNNYESKTKKEKSYG